MLRHRVGVPRDAALRLVDVATLVVPKIDPGGKEKKEDQAAEVEAATLGEVGPEVAYALREMRHDTELIGELSRCDLGFRLDPLTIGTGPMICMAPALEPLDAPIVVGIAPS